MLVLAVSLTPERLQAVDSKGVHQVAVKITGPLGSMLDGVTATVKVPPQEGEEEFYATLPIAQQTGGWSALQGRGFVTDAFGFVTVPYLSGRSSYDSNLYGEKIFLPHEIVVSAKGYVTKRLKFEERSFFLSHLQLPFFEISLAPLKKGAAPREEEQVLSFKQVPIPGK